MKKLVDLELLAQMLDLAYKVSHQNSDIGIEAECLGPAIRAALDAPQQEADGYIYEYESPFGGVHKELTCRQWNGREPCRTIPYYLHPAPSVPESWQPSDDELTNIYNTANGLDPKRHNPITTERIFTAMRAMLSAAPKAPTTDDRKDAKRYRWLRSQHEGKTPMELDADGMPMPSEARTDVFVVFKPGDDISLEPVGSCSGELDEAIDAAIAAQKGEKE